MKKKRNKGFTLIELIIVVAIIGILASIAVPKFGNIQRDAKIKADLATARIIQQVTSLQIITGELSNADTIEIKKDQNGNYSGNAKKIIAMLQQEPVNNFACNYFIKVENDTAIIYVTKEINNKTEKVQIYPQIYEDPYEKMGL